MKSWAWTMQTIKVHRAELLATIQKIGEGLAHYRAAAIEELERMIQEAREGKPIRRALRLVEPVDQTANYDAAIRIPEMSVDDVIEIDYQSFREVVASGPTL